jgi:hypothetical protein
LVIAITTALMAGAIGFFLIAKRSQARADDGVTTETTAPAPGAQVTATGPKLRVEPK